MSWKDVESKRAFEACEEYAGMWMTGVVISIVAIRFTYQTWNSLCADVCLSVYVSLVMTMSGN